MARRNVRLVNYFSSDRSLEDKEYILNSREATLTPGIYLPKNHEKFTNFLGKKYIRAVFKNGNFNIDQKPKGNKICCNYIPLLVETRWRWTLLNVCLAFTLNWLFFAVIYWIISLKHGDFNKDHLPPLQNTTNFVPCIKNMYSFTSAFLFSIEIYTTVAYGRRSITLECPETITAMCFQSMISSIFQAIMVGILFAKLTSPRARTRTILFSKHAVVNLRNDKFCLIFRVGDIRKSKILNIKPKAYVIRLKTEFTEIESSEQIELKVDIDECESTFFLWPVTIVHVIDENSPFYGLSAPDLLCSHLEILVVFEGIIESTGQPVQARTSYTEHDILWGHRLTPMVGYNLEKMMYDVDFSKLSEIQEVDTPLCSAKQYNTLLLDLFNDSVSQELLIHGSFDAVVSVPDY